MSQQYFDKDGTVHTS